MKAKIVRSIILLMALPSAAVMMAKTIKSSDQHTDSYFTASVVDKLWNVLDMIPGINKRVMGIMLQVHHEIQKMKDGDPFHNHEGIYSFEEKNYSVKALAHLEQEYAQDHENGSMSDEAYAKKQTLFKVCLTGAKKDFDSKVSKFMGIARQAKEFLTILIQESCEKHNTPDSFLLTWGQVSDDNDLKAFYDNIKTFKQHHELLTDLLHFMRDLINRSPRAKAEFMEQVKRNKQHHKK